MAAGNIERFDVLVGAIFAKLYQEFPIAVDLMMEDFESQMAVNQPERDINDHYNRRDVLFFLSTVIWLSNHDYLDSGSQAGDGVMGCVLTARTLELLKAMPSNLEAKKPSLGEQLVSATKEGMTVKTKELVSEFLSKAVALGTKTATEWVI